MTRGGSAGPTRTTCRVQRRSGRPLNGDLVDRSTTIWSTAQRRSGRPLNDDLVDRAPANDAVIELVSRLIAEAPPGRVRITLGNHEALILSPGQFGFSAWYSGQVDGIYRLMHRHRSSAIHATPQTKGRVHCQHVLRSTVDSAGGQAVFVETPDELSALIRQPEDGVNKQTLSSKP